MMNVWTKAHKFYLGRYAVVVGGVLVGTNLTWNQAQIKVWRHQTKPVWGGQVKVIRLPLNPRWDKVYMRG